MGGASGELRSSGGGSATNVRGGVSVAAALEGSATRRTMASTAVGRTNAIAKQPPPPVSPAWVALSFVLRPSRAVILVDWAAARGHSANQPPFTASQNSIRLTASSTLAGHRCAAASRRVKPRAERRGWRAMMHRTVSKAARAPANKALDASTRSSGSAAIVCVGSRPLPIRGARHSRELRVDEL